MRTRSRACLMALTTAIVLGAIVSAASARRIEFSNQSFKSVWAAGEKLKFITEIEIECVATLEGSFHSRTISKVSGQLIGVITRAAIGRPCEGQGEAWFLNGIEVQEAVTLPNTLPWHVRYDSFTGTLPAITGVRVQIIGASILVVNGLSRCLFRSTAAEPAYAVIEVATLNGVVTGFRPVTALAIPLNVVQAGVCMVSMRWERRGVFTLLAGTTTRIIVRLVQ